MNIRDLPVVEFSEKELEHLQRMARGDGEECPIATDQGNEEQKEIADHR